MIGFIPTTLLFANTWKRPVVVLNRGFILDFAIMLLEKGRVQFTQFQTETKHSNMKMKKLLLSSLLVACALAVNAQDPTPVSDGALIGGADTSPNPIPAFKLKSLTSGGPTTSSLTISNGLARYDVFLWWIRGPIRTNATSDLAYDPFAATRVSQCYSNYIAFGTNDVGQTLRTEFVTQQTANRTNETLHLMVRVVGRNGAKVSLSMLKCLMYSSDNAHSLSNLYDLSTITNLVYSLKAWGISYGPGGARVSDAILHAAESGNTLVDEIIFIGAQSKYYTWTDAASYTAVDGYINNYSPTFVYFGQWIVVDGSSNVLASSSLTLRANGSNMPPVLSINNLDPKVRVGINMETNVSAALYSSPQLPALGWSLVGTVNANDVYEPVKVTPSGKEFYRAVLLPERP